MRRSAQELLLDNRCTLWPGQTEPDQIREACAAAGLTIVGLAPYLAVGDLEALRAVLDLAGPGTAPSRRRVPRSLRAHGGHEQRYARPAVHGRRGGRPRHERLTGQVGAAGVDQSAERGEVLAQPPDRPDLGAAERLLSPRRRLPGTRPRSNRPPAAACAVLA